MRGGTHMRSRTTAVGKQHAYRLISSITRWLHWHLPGKATRAQFRAAELPRASQLCFHCTSASSPLRYSKFHQAPTAWPTQSHSVVNSKWWCDHREQLQSPLQINKKNHHFDSTRVSSLRTDWAGFISGPKTFVRSMEQEYPHVRIWSFCKDHTATSSPQFSTRLQDALKMSSSDEEATSR